MKKLNQALLISLLLIYGTLKYFDLIQSNYLLYLIAMIEVGFFIYLAYKAKRVIAVFKDERDNYYFADEALHASVAKVFGTHMILKFLFSEISIFLYAFLGWILKPYTSKGTLFSYHRTTQYSVLFWVVFISTVITTPIFHFLLMQWHEVIAWVVTGFTIYGLIWLYGDYRVIKHKPIVLLEETLLIRIGIRWRADVKLSNIKSIESSVSKDFEEEYTNISILAFEKNIFITLYEPIVIEGIFGITKRTSKIALYVDEVDVFKKDILNIML